MAAETGQPAPAGDAAGKKEQKQQPKNQPKDQPAQGEAAAGEKKLSNAELKKKQKEEKAARRAAAKSVPPPPAPGAGGQQGDGKGGKAKPKQDGPGHHVRSASRSALPPMVKEVKPKVPECFSHLSMARRIAITQADKDVNPVVLALGQHMSTFAITDSITRLEATLLAFKKVRAPAAPGSSQPLTQDR